MTPTRLQKDQIVDLVRSWSKKLFLNSWNFKIEYIKEDSGSQAAEITMKSRYQIATISLQPKFWEEDAEHREMIIVHELCHCILAPLVEITYDAANNHAVSGREIGYWKEAVTQAITNAVFWSNRR